MDIITFRRYTWVETCFFLFVTALGGIFNSQLSTGGKQSFIFTKKEGGGKLISVFGMIIYYCFISEGIML